MAHTHARITHIPSPEETLKVKAYMERKRVQKAQAMQRRIVKQFNKLETRLSTTDKIKVQLFRNFTLD